MVGSAVIKQGRSANRKHTYFFFWPRNVYYWIDLMPDVTVLLVLFAESSIGEMFT